MKTFVIFLLASLTILAQPMVKTKIQKPLAGAVYTVYVDIKPTNTTSVLVEDLDPLTSNISSYVQVLTNVTVSGDTTFGEFSLPVTTATQYVKVGISSTETGKKPSLLKVSSWLAVSPRSTKPSFITIQEK